MFSCTIGWSLVGLNYGVQLGKVVKSSWAKVQFYEIVQSFELQLCARLWSLIEQIVNFSCARVWSLVGLQLWSSVVGSIELNCELQLCDLRLGCNHCGVCGV
ncbi:hypothetical protein CEXT_49491 [Caerostris extrusa]|uniref:Uncharacterized protein n=1 Tax=Caerostris extrusa TaxID=172846 RepID=A0AAV4UTE5_CAEEX|nr:hypothetical protein CEXT_49491 [Caerostris extrusa]